MFNGLPHCGKDKNQIIGISLPTDVMLKVLKPVFNARYNVTCDNYLTSLHLLRRLSEKKISLHGTLCQNKQEILTLAKQKKQLYDTKVYKTVNTYSATLTNYRCKSSKNVFILVACMEMSMSILDNNKKKSDTVVSYNETKGTVDTYEQMLRLYNTKSESRTWQMYVFYNIVDMALINSHIVYKYVTKSIISRKNFI